MFWIDEFRREVGLSFLPKLNTNILRADKTMTEDAAIVFVFFDEASVFPLHLFHSSPQSALSADVWTLLRNEPTSANPPLQCQKTGRAKENQHVRLFRIFSIQSIDALHYKNSQ